MPGKLTALSAGLCALALSLGTHAATEQYREAKKQMQADYKLAKAECSKLDRPEKKNCMEQAKANRDAAKQRLKSLK